MSNPNTSSIRISKSSRELAESHLNMGMLPLVPHERHPSIIYKWNVHHVIAPSLSVEKDARWKSANASWKDFIWVEAWVVALFQLTDNNDILNNAFTTLQENKPKILDLKISYDEALRDPDRRLVLLTEYRLRYIANPDVLRAIEAATRKTYKECDGD